MMQSARKLILVDENDREYKRLQRPTNAVAKTKHSSRQHPCRRSKSQRIRGRSPSILELAQTSSGGTERASQPYHCYAAAASAATTTTTAGVSHTIAFGGAADVTESSVERGLPFDMETAYSDLRFAGSFGGLKICVVMPEQRPVLQENFWPNEILTRYTSRGDCGFLVGDLLERHRGPLSDRFGGRVRSFVARRRIQILADVYRRV